MFDDWLTQHKVIVCVGSGGVGKTTIASALGLRGQQLGLKVLVLTIDPARRLADALGLSQDIDDPILIFKGKEGGELYACMLNSERVFDQFVEKTALHPERINKLFKSRLYQQLKTSLSGSQEFTAMERLRSFVDSGRFDLVVLDTPPAQHAMDFLMAPLKLNSLFQSTVIQWFAQGVVGTRGFFRTIFQRGTVVVMRSLERLTGASFVQELSDFFSSIGDWHEVLQSRTRQVHELLTSEQAQFALITSFDKTKIREAIDFAHDLEEQGYHLGLTVLNRSFPQWLAGEDEDKEVVPSLQLYYRQLKKYYNENERACDELNQTLGHKMNIIRIPDFNQEINSLADLQNVLLSVTSFSKTE